ncbi:MAG: sulfatase [Spirochaetes bacterium GWF1_41_5]|nr:MAG: sulfatase [Spirochaetes bacterium GWF1_41_5]HBE03820.1 sulfatase [Spirochaetia bacterium]
MSSKPNILLITSDQQHWNTIGAFFKEIKTPNLDRLVKEGTTFLRAYCPNPTCTPTRASIITGQYPSQHGAWTLGTKLPENIHTVNEDFSGAGYKTALIGKAHFQQLASTEEFPSIESNPLMQDLDFWRNYNKKFYGFDHIELARNHTCEYHVGQHYAIWMEEKGFKNWRDYFQAPAGKLSGRMEGAWGIPEEFHYNAWIAERTNSMMEQYKKNNENFFLWASFLDPHPPYLIPEPWAHMYNPDELTVPSITEGEMGKMPRHHRLTQQAKPDFSEYNKSGFYCHGFSSHLHDQDDMAKKIAIYYGMISCMDKYIGLILDHLKKSGLEKNTMVVFSTDHGHFYGQHGLNAKGAFHYEDMIKIPFIARYPGQIPAGKTSSALQSLVDLAPTFLDYCGIKTPGCMTGISQKDVWNNKAEKARDHIICENHHESDTVHLKTYVDDRYKITVYLNSSEGELFDLKEDPGEINNLWSSSRHEKLKSELLLKYIWAELGKEPMWMPRVAGA